MKPRLLCALASCVPRLFGRAQLPCGDLVSTRNLAGTSNPKCFGPSCFHGRRLSQAISPPRNNSLEDRHLQNNKAFRDGPAHSESSVRPPYGTSWRLRGHFSKRRGLPDTTSRGCPVRGSSLFRPLFGTTPPISRHHARHRSRWHNKRRDYSSPSRFRDRQPCDKAPPPCPSLEGRRYRRRKPGQAQTRPSDRLSLLRLFAFPDQAALRSNPKRRETEP